MAEGGSYSLFNPLPFSEDRGLVSHTIGMAMVAQAPPYAINVLSVCEREVQWYDNTNHSEPISLRASRGPSSGNDVL